MTQILKNGTLVTLARDSRGGGGGGGIGIIVGYVPQHTTPATGGTHGLPGSSAEAYQVMWSTGPDKQFHIDECWINPAYLKAIPDGN